MGVSIDGIGKLWSSNLSFSATRETLENVGFSNVFKGFLLFLKVRLGTFGYIKIHVKCCQNFVRYFACEMGRGKRRGSKEDGWTGGGG